MKLAQKDRDARWTVKYTKAKVREDGSLPPVDLAIPAFGYKNHVSIERAPGLIRKWTATHAAAHDGARLVEDVSTAPKQRARSMQIRCIARRRMERCCRGAASRFTAASVPHAPKLSQPARHGTWTASMLADRRFPRFQQ